MCRTTLWRGRRATSTTFRHCPEPFKNYSSPTAFCKQEKVPWAALVPGIVADMPGIDRGFLPPDPGLYRGKTGFLGFIWNESRPDPSPARACKKYLRSPGDRAATRPKAAVQRWISVAQVRTKGHAHKPDLACTPRRRGHNPSGVYSRRPRQPHRCRPPRSCLGLQFYCSGLQPPWPYEGASEGREGYAQPEARNLLQVVLHLI